MKKLNVAVVGAGIWGTNHANVFSSIPEANLRAVCDMDEKRAGELASKFGAENVCTTVEEVLALPDIDAITIATPDHTHTKLVLAGLEAGKHVMTEKPLATTVEEAEAVVAAADRAPGVLMVDFHLRTHPAFDAARRAVADNRIGQPLHISSRLSDTVFVPLEMLSWAAQSSALWFLGCHVVDILRFVTGQEVTRVYGVRRRGHLASQGVDTDDVHLSILEFDGGLVAQMENSWVHPKDGPSIFDLMCEVYGSAGAMQINVSHNGTMKLYSGEGLTYPDVQSIAPTGPGRVGGMVLEAIARFVDAALHGEPVLASARDGLAATRVLAAIEESAGSGKAVEIARG